MEVRMKPEELRKWRLKMGYTQTELGLILGVSMRQMIRYERGVSPIPDMLRLALRSVPSKKSLERGE
jgi:transcriptional regulator with XRE-family HTH domain